MTQNVARATLYGPESNVQSPESAVKAGLWTSDQGPWTSFVGRPTLFWLNFGRYFGAHENSLLGAFLKRADRVINGRAL
jgi:hypothetical protein